MLQPGPAVQRQVMGRAEQAGVAGDAFPGEAVLVVHFALQQPVAPAAVLGRGVGGWFRLLVSRVEVVLVLAGRPEPVFWGEAVRPLAADPLTRSARRQEADVALDGSAPGWRAEARRH